MLPRLLLAFLSLTIEGPVRGQEARPSALPESLQAKPVTLNGTFSLPDALAELGKQTGNVVENRSTVPEPARLKLNLKNATFWQALDTIARDADLRVSLYQRDGKIALVDGPFREVPVSYDGLFRIRVKSIAANRDLETDAHYYIAQLEVAWEPRVQAFFLEMQPQQGRVVDDRDREWPIVQGSKSPISVLGRPAVEVEVRFTPPPRSPAPVRNVGVLGLLRGELKVTAAGQMLTFVFDKLTFKEQNFQPQTRTIDGVQVTLERFVPAQGFWTIGLSMKYPPGGPELESYQNTISENPLFLVKANRRFLSNAGSNFNQTGNLADANYFFQDDRDAGLVLGKPSDWSIEYRTPSPAAQLPVRFEFKDIPLP